VQGAWLGSSPTHLFYVCELGGGLDREADGRRRQVRDGELRADGRLSRGEHIYKMESVERRGVSQPGDGE
jgi:hypothetical protein